MDTTPDPILTLAPDHLELAPTRRDVDKHQCVQVEALGALAAMRHQVRLHRPRAHSRPLPQRSKRDRTFGEWAGVSPGSVQADLVAHCGESTEGFYLNTLVLVDVATSWCEFEVIWGKGKDRVGGGIHRARQRMPFRLEELHTDNGSEFINDLLYPYTRDQKIRFTRGRAYRKNDQAYVEQKNWSVPRPVSYTHLRAHETRHD